MSFILQSNALKNHFGTVRFGNGHQYPVILHGEHLESHIADINANYHVRDKTRVCIADALFGAGCFTRGDNGRTPGPWKTLGTGKTPNSLFFSTDPVALESVVGDFITQEQTAVGFAPFPHDYLHYAAEMGLGVHDHSRKGTEYVGIRYDEIFM
jgi:hypothetical protein